MKNFTYGYLSINFFLFGMWIETRAIAACTVPTIVWFFSPSVAVC